MYLECFYKLRCGNGLLTCHLLHCYAISPFALSRSISLWVCMNFHFCHYQNISGNHYWFLHPSLPFFKGTLSLILLLSDYNHLLRGHVNNDILTICCYQSRVSDENWSETRPSYILIEKEIVANFSSSSPLNDMTSSMKKEKKKKL